MQMLTRRQGQSRRECEYAPKLEVVRDVQVGSSDALSCEVLKFLLEDCDRAQAAYPDFSLEQLIERRWLLVGEDAFPLLPETTQKNFGSPREVRTLIPVVRSQFIKRVSLEDATLFLERKKQQQQEERLRRLREEGPPRCWSSDFSISYDREQGIVTVDNTPHRTTVGTRWKFPFVLEEWIPLVDDQIHIKAIKKLPSFQRAEESFFRIKPNVSGEPFQGSIEDWRKHERREVEAIEQQELPLREKLGINYVQKKQ